jgi:hypothetical protein
MTKANDRDTAQEAVRALLFDKAAEINRRLQERIDSVAEDLNAGNACGVIGAIEGAEQEIGVMRALMLLARDEFNQTTTQGGQYARKEAHRS